MREKYFHLILLSLVILAPYTQSAIAENAALFDSLKYNVIKIKATFPGNATQSGFGFVVGADEQFEYYVTANHVVRNLNGPASEIKVSFHVKNRPKQYAKLLEMSDSSLDLAVLKVAKHREQFGLWRRDAIGSVNSGDKVWFIGQGSKWTTPKVPGHVATAPSKCNTIFDNSATVSVVDMKSRKGSSGAPLVSDTGIVGMMLCSGEQQVALKIERIRDKIQSSQWQLPWQLSERKLSPNLSGVWQYWDQWDDVNAELSLEALDEAHYKFSANSLDHDTALTGVILVNGNEIYSDLNNSDRTKGIIRECSKGYGLFISGTIYDSDPDEDPYKMRLTRIDNKAHGSKMDCPKLDEQHKNVIATEKHRPTEQKQLVKTMKAAKTVSKISDVSLMTKPTGLKTPSAMTDADPKLVGCWKWSNGAYVVIGADGTAHNAHIGATWETLGPNGDRYLISWPSLVDSITLSADGTAFNGTNNFGGTFFASRKSGSVKSLIGSWLWNSGVTADIRPDSSVTAGSLKGTWYKMGDQWTIEWPIVDTVSIAKDGNSLSIKNQFGVATGERDAKCQHD